MLMLLSRVQVNLPGKTHDAKAWNVSKAKELVEYHYSRSEYVVEVEGRRLRSCALGDSAYPGSEYLLKPFLQSSTNDTDKRPFNLRHCRTRQIVGEGLVTMREKDLACTYGTEIACPGHAADSSVAGSYQARHMYMLLQRNLKTAPLRKYI